MATENLTQELIGQFVGAAHGDEATVRQLLEAHPDLLNERYEQFNETALEAASHMGRRSIAEHLLAAGAPLTICAAAMLGRADDVAAFLRDDPALANSAGAHGIPLIFHAALSGNTAITQMLLDSGGGDGIAGALHAAAWYGHRDMAEWLIAHGADVNAPNYENKPPLAVARAFGNDAVAEILRAHGGREE